MREPVESDTLGDGVERILEAMALPLFTRVHHASSDLVVEAGAWGVDEEDLDRGVSALQGLRAASDGASCPCTAHERIDLSPRLIPYLLPGPQVRSKVGLVLKLRVQRPVSA